MMMGIFAAEDPCRVRRTNPCRGDGRAKSFERCLLGAPWPDPIVFASAKMMIMSRMKIIMIVLDCKQQLLLVLNLFRNARTFNQAPKIHKN